MKGTSRFLGKSRLIAVLACALMATFSLAVAAPANAATGSTTTASAAVTPNYAAGVKDYICENVDGSSWTLVQGESTTDCHGSALLQYWDSGVFIQSIPLTPSGTIGSGTVPSLSCVVALAGTAVAILDASNTVRWYVAAGLAGLADVLDCGAGE
jgi:hypothetical protein